MTMWTVEASLQVSYRLFAQHVTLSPTLQAQARSPSGLAACQGQAEPMAGHLLHTSDSLTDIVMVSCNHEMSW